MEVLQLEIGDIIECIQVDGGIEIGKTYQVSRGNYSYGSIPILDCINLLGKGTSPYKTSGFKFISKQNIEPLIFN